jgi:hypothetical protein
MARLAIELTHTAKELTKLERALVRINAERAQTNTLSGATPPFPTVTDWITSQCQNLLNSNIETQREIERQGIRSAYAAATESQQAQIDAILGLT